jgi:SAM-dependent methyltransferase
MDSILSPNPFQNLSPDDINQIFEILKSQPMLLLQIDSIRAFIAQKRLNHYLSHQKIAFSNSRDFSIGNTAEYNARALLGDFYMLRPMQLIEPLRAIEKILTTAPHRKVLTVGPRSEMEIFGLYSVGFSPENITAIDLISYSPLVELGDMHSLPYASNSFDVIILGWVLAYSTEPHRAASEVIRCLKHGGIIAVGNDYNPANDGVNNAMFSDKTLHAEPVEEDKKFHPETVEDLISLFGDHVGKVYFRHEPDNASLGTGKQLMAIFEIEKQSTTVTEETEEIDQTSNSTQMIWF